MSNEYRNKFIKDTYKSYLIKFNKVKDRELIEHLAKYDNTTDYIRTLINEDIQAFKRQYNIDD